MSNHILPFRTRSELAAENRQVGVVIPVFNRRTTLLGTLPYVARQTHLPARVVIVDDGSTDGTADAAEAWLSASTPRFGWRVVRCAHTSAARARCVGFTFVRDLPWIAYLDSDDHWPADFLARAVGALTAESSAVAASADRAYFNASGNLAASDDMQEFVADPIPWIFTKGAGIASCTVVRTHAVQRVGDWQPELGSAEDAAFYAKIAAEGTWLHLPGAPVNFHLGSAGVRQEENNLTHRFADRNLRWARVFEQIYEDALECQPMLNSRPLRAALSRRWCAAAKQLSQLGRVEEAREAAQRAIHWRSTYLRAWQWRVRLALSPTAQVRRAA
jgi:glycosyltransferase involved in cell wall biosynthesis